MNALEIPRMKLSGRDEVLSEREQLATDASKVLGYKKLALALTVPDSLLGALRRLDIAPLDETSVKRYQKSKEKFGMWDSQWAAIGALCVFAVSTSMLFFCAHNASVLPNITFGQVASCVGALVSAIVALISLITTFGAWFDKEVRGRRTVWSWEIFELSGFNGAVPEFVLAKALQIKSECPDATFYVENLMKSEERLPDPFLVAEFGDERYYIEVWDEKEYEIQL